MNGRRSLCVQEGARLTKVCPCVRPLLGHVRLYYIFSVKLLNIYTLCLNGTLSCVYFMDVIMPFIGDRLYPNSYPTQTHACMHYIVLVIHREAMHVPRYIYEVIGNGGLQICYS